MHLIVVGVAFYFVAVWPHAILFQISYVFTVVREFYFQFHSFYLNATIKILLNRLVALCAHEISIWIREIKTKSAQQNVSVMQHTHSITSMHCATAEFAKITRTETSSVFVCVNAIFHVTTPADYIK